MTALGPNARATLVVAAVLLLPVAVIAVCFWPGLANADTLTQANQARTGVITNQHAPVLTWLWSFVWPIGIGLGYVLVAQLLVTAVGVYLMLRAAFQPIASALLTGAVLVFPPVLGTLAVVGRDAWFAGSLTMMFGLLARGAVSEGQARRRCLIGATAFAFVALVSRQNAAPAVVLGCVLVAGMALERRRRRGVLVATAAGVALTGALMLLQVSITRAIAPADSNPEQYVFVYDLGAVSVSTGENLFPADVVPDRRLESIETHWIADSVLPMVVPADAPLKAFLPAGKVDSLRAAWRDAILDHPGAYLDARWTLWLRQIALTRVPRQVYHPGIDQSFLGITPRFPDLFEAGLDYLDALTINSQYDGSVIFTTWIYLLIAIACAAVWLAGRPRTWIAAVVAGFALSAITYQIGLFFGAMSVYLRFEYPAVLVGVVSLLLLIARVVGVVAERRSAPAGARPWRRARTA